MLIYYILNISFVRSHTFYFRGTELMLAQTLTFFFFCKYEVKSCYAREFRGERHNQGWRGGLTSTTRDGIFGEGRWGVA